MEAKIIYTPVKLTGSLIFDYFTSVVTSLVNSYVCCFIVLNGITIMISNIFLLT